MEELALTEHGPSRDAAERQDNAPRGASSLKVVPPVGGRRAELAARATETTPTFDRFCADELELGDPTWIIDATEAYRLDRRGDRRNLALMGARFTEDANKRLPQQLREKGCPPFQTEQVRALPSRVDDR